MKKQKLFLKVLTLSFVITALFISTTKAAIIKGGKENKESNGAYYEYEDADAQWGLQFDALKDITIHSVKVYNGASSAGSYTGERVITVYNSNGDVVKSVNVNIIDGEQRLTLDIFVPKGTNYRLIADNHIGFWRDKVGGYPFAIEDACNITGDIRFDGKSLNTANYHFFYDWEIEATAAPLTSAFDYSYTGRDVSFTNTSTGATTYSWDFGDGSTASTEKNPTHTYSADGSYTVKMVATSEGNSSASEATFEVSNTPTQGAALPKHNNKAILEMSTSTACSNCPPVISRLTKYWKADKDHIAYVEYHTIESTDSFMIVAASNGTPNVRDKAGRITDNKSGYYYYYATGHPEYTLNGNSWKKNPSDPWAMSWPGNDNPTQTMINDATAKAGDFEISGAAAIENGDIRVVTSLKAKKDFTSQLVVFIAVVEDDMHFSYKPGKSGRDNGERDFNGVLRFMLPNNGGKGTNMKKPQSIGNVTDIDVSIPFPENKNSKATALKVRKNNARVVVWVQSDEDHLMKAATDFKLSDKIESGNVLPSGSGKSTEIPTEISNNINNTINVYPNPFNNNVNIDINGQQTVVSIYSLSGTIVYQNNNISSTVNIDASDWKAGVYILKTQNKSGLSVKKIIKK